MHPCGRTFRRLERGYRIGGYRVVGPPMRGGFAAVYRCVSDVDGSSAAVKVLDESHVAARRRAVQRFEQEVEAIRRIGHPNIVEVFAQGVLEDGRPYYVMEWLDGRSLEEELWMRGPLLPVDALPIVEEIAAALSAAHAVGVVHRDLKPENIMAVPKKDWLSIKLLDFGIAKLVGASDSSQGLTTTGITLGTVHYMAPEQILCDTIDARTDVYALGVLVYRMVTGELPFRAKGRVALQMMHLDHPAPKASELAPAAAPWDGVIQQCMSKAPSDRPQSVAAVVASLRAALSRRPAEVAEIAAANRIALLFEIAGEARSQTAWNARSSALARASAWIRAAGWRVAIEADNALVAHAVLDHDKASAGAQQAVLVSAARRFVNMFRSGKKLPWAVAEQPESPIARSGQLDKFVARAWILPASARHPLHASAAELPSGVYMARSFVSKSFLVAANSLPDLPEFVCLETQEVRP